jgi:outer membrane lipoprotein LolB
VRAETEWVLNARIVASNEDDSWNGKLYWQQGKDRYQVNFVAPIGQGGLQLDGRPGQVEMRTSDGHVMAAADAESLLYQQLGWRLPLSKLRFWVRGIPAPSSHNMPVLAFDEDGRLSRLRQADWRIDYPAYQQTDGPMLPRKVFLENTDLSVRLVIDRWEGRRGQQ